MDFNFASFGIGVGVGVGVGIIADETVRAISGADSIFSDTDSRAMREVEYASAVAKATVEHQKMVARAAAHAKLDKELAKADS